ncbi:GntR family transcriptional regulator [Nocardia sp. 852002-20019_SCH5090214]|uniref:GntR family transcriptional regulator n=1 Tax=Nocardia sp. 852002-20019_SCH5090214 TaxID=1834087 RepID=UPI0007EB149B|nr:GntR family transcriptional regulator [Nocardia sp. 852002-20019_SCH5090214]OBA55846.1 GntR family transcriptional regulator [Nocardia sp. 852002-20019_SCH5090214]
MRRDRVESEPAYRAVARSVRAELAAGRYAGGVALPTEMELAQRHRVSRHTVRRAFQDLVAAGEVYRVAGRGTFATGAEQRYLRQFGSIEDLMQLSSDTTMQVRSGLRRRVDIEAASRLRLDTDVVYTVVFVRLHDGVPFVCTTVHLPEPIARSVAAAPELADGASSPYTVIGLLEPHLNSPIVEAAQSITVAAATPATAAELGCAPGHPMLRVDRLYSDAGGAAVELSVSQFLPEHYTYRVTLRRSGVTPA